MKANNESEKRVLEYFKAHADAALKAKAEAENKTPTGAMAYAAKQARKMRKSGEPCVCVADDVVFGWVMDYFAGAENCEPAGTVPEGAEAEAAKPAAVQAKPTAKKAEPKDDSQMDLFAMMEGAGNVAA